jgi:cardiolipin synthase A/B
MSDSRAMQTLDKLVCFAAHDPIEVDGHQLELVTDCDDRLGRYLQLLGEATTAIDIIIYVFENDAAGNDVRAALVAAAARGVAVRMVIDSFGCNLTSDDFFDPLREAGVDLVFFSRRWRTTYLIRNHQKMLIIDRKTLFFGGFNLAQCYFDGNKTTGWTDLGLVLSGPAAAAMNDWFERLFAFTKQSDGKWLQLRRMIRSWQRANPPQGQFQWLVGGPTQRLSPWARAIRTDLVMARRIDMAMAYFSPGQGMLRRMGRAARQWRDYRGRALAVPLSAAPECRCFRVSAAAVAYEIGRRG